MEHNGSFTDLYWKKILSGKVLFLEGQVKINLLEKEYRIRRREGQGEKRGEKEEA
jgi:hypothetical protein